MGDTWVTDMRHYLDDEDLLAEALPGPVFNIAVFLGSIVAWVTSHPQGICEWTNVPCRRTPGHKRCLGEIFARLDDASGTIIWECPMCGDNGYIHGWKGTLWDRQTG